MGSGNCLSTSTGSPMKRLPTPLFRASFPVRDAYGTLGANWLDY